MTNTESPAPRTGVGNLGTGPDAPKAGMDTGETLVSGGPEIERPEAAVASLDAPATVTEVREYYRLLLDREPESEVVVVSRSGMPIRDVVKELLGSGEFVSRNQEVLLWLFA